MSNSSEKINIRRRCHGGVAIAIAAATALAAPVSGFRCAGTRTNAIGTRAHSADVSFLEIDKDITLRRMVVHNTKPRGPFSSCMDFRRRCTPGKTSPLALAGDYEVHAFDWPGFGLSSRPTVDRFSYAPRTSHAFWTTTYAKRASTHRSSRSTQPNRRSAGSSPGSGKARHREHRSSSATSPPSTGLIICTRACRA